MVPLGLASEGEEFPLQRLVDPPADVCVKCSVLSVGSSDITHLKCFFSVWVLLCYVFAVLGMEPRASCELGTAPSIIPTLKQVLLKEIM